MFHKQNNQSILQRNPPSYSAASRGVAKNLISYMTNSYLKKVAVSKINQKIGVFLLISPSGVLHHIVIKYGTSQYPNGTVLCCDIFVLTEEGQTCHLPHSGWSAVNDDSNYTKNMFQDLVLIVSRLIAKKTPYHSGIMLPKKQTCQFIKNVF